MNPRTVLAAALVAPVLALADPAAPPAAAPAAPTVKWGGLVDSYYSLNLNAPQTVPSPLAGFSANPGLRLSYAEVNVTVDAGAAGMRLDLGYAPAALPTTNLFVQQAYATYKFPKGVTADFGRFVTSAGAEVIEAKDNWLYTRSLLFFYAIPFAHNGLRVTVPVRENLNLQLGVLNGWDDDNLASALASGLRFNLSPHKTFNASLAYSKDATSANLNLYTGQEAAAQGTRTLVDIVVQQGFGPLTANVNFDFGAEDKLPPTVSAKPSASWWGLAGMVRYSFPGDVFRLSARVEYFDDSDGGYRLGYRAPADPTKGVKVYEGTLGASYPVGTNAELRAELRYDVASDKVFAVSTDPAVPAKDSFPTFQVAALAWF